MLRITRLTLFIVLAWLLTTVGCDGASPATPTTDAGLPNPATPTTNAGLPNPASVFCEARGGTLALRTDAGGGQVGYCIFASGSECEEWAYYRGECAPAGWQVYSHATPAYRFEYPADATIVANDDPLRSISVNGPPRDGDLWPQFTISHPTDLADWQPPADVDLAQWLSDHNLLEGGRQADLTIGGEPAVHLRFDRSPQSYAYDRYYVAHAGQLYMIVIGHAGDHEDWALYDQFLGSFAFMP